MTIGTPTGPVALPPLNLASIQAAIEQIQQNILNLQANRQPQAFHLGDLLDTSPLLDPDDGQLASYDASTGLWTPVDPPSLVIPNPIYSQVPSTLTATTNVFTSLSGPVITENAVGTGSALVLLNAFIKPAAHASVGESGYMGVSVNGDAASSRPYAEFSDFSGTGCGAGASCTQVITGLAVGTSYTFETEYRTSSSSGFSSSFSANFMSVLLF